MALLFLTVSSSYGFPEHLRTLFCTCFISDPQGPCERATVTPEREKGGREWESSPANMTQLPGDRETSRTTGFPCTLPQRPAHFPHSTFQLGLIHLFGNIFDKICLPHVMISSTQAGILCLSAHKHLSCD